MVRVHLGLPLSKERKNGENYEPYLWGCSSAGRAPALQAGGHGFESHHLHQEKNEEEGSTESHHLYQALKRAQMFIENRIEKRNETDSCILRKTCYKEI